MGLNWKLAGPWWTLRNKLQRTFTVYIYHSLVFQYVGYARKYVHPKITPEAAQIIQVKILIIHYIMGDFQPCAPCVWIIRNIKSNHALESRHGWDSNDWLIKKIWIFIKLRFVLFLSHVFHHDYTPKIWRSKWKRPNQRDDQRVLHFDALT